MMIAKKNKLLFILILLLFFAILIGASSLSELKNKDRTDLDNKNLNLDKEMANKSGFYWLVSHNEDGSINFNNYYSGNKINICIEESFEKSLKVDFYYKNNNDFGVTRNIYNLSDNTSFIKNGCGDKRNAIEVNIGSGSIPLLLSIVPELPDQRVFIQGSTDFPFQGNPEYDMPLFLLEAVTAGNSIITK